MHLESMEKKSTGNLKKVNSNQKTVIDVYFELFQKRSFFLNNPNFEVNLNEKVVVDTKMGLTIGKVLSIKSDKTIENLDEPLTEIVRIATKNDLEKEKILKEDAVKAGFIFRNKLKKYNLENLKLVATEYTFDKKKLIFYFACEDRIDFRLLVKELAGIFKLRIELRQIGVRDYAKMVGDCGSCGKTLCCKSIINKFDSVSIKMAREQGVHVTPSKMSGVCGRLKCCMNFEYSQYSEIKDNYPLVGQNVVTEDGNGNVTSLNLLNDEIFVNIEEKGLQKYGLSQVKFDENERIELEKYEYKNSCESMYE